MKVNLHVLKVEIVPVEIPDKMLTNIIFDNCKANLYDHPETAVVPGRDDYTILEDYISEHYGYTFMNDFRYANVKTANGEEVPVLVEY